MSRIIRFFEQIGFNEHQANAIIDLLKISQNLQRDIFFQDLEILKMHFEKPENLDEERKFKEIVKNEHDEDVIDLEKFFDSEIYSDKNIRDYLIYATQKLFGRKAFEERNKITSQSWFESNSEDIYKILTKLEMTQAKKSSFENPDYSFVFGAAFGRIYLRCKSLIDEISKQNISQDHQKYLVCGSRVLGLEGITYDDGCKKYQIDRKSVDWSSVSGNDELEKLILEFEASDLFKNYVQSANSEENEATRLGTRKTENEIKTERLKGEQVIGEFIARKISHESKIEIQVLEDHAIIKGEVRGTTKTNAERILNEIFQDQTNKSSDSQSKKILLVFNNPHSERMCIDFKNATKENHEKYNLNLDVSYMGEGIAKPTMQAISEIPSLVQAKFKHSLIMQKTDDQIAQVLNQFKEITMELQFRNHEEMLQYYQVKSTPVLSQRESSPTSSLRSVSAKSASLETSCSISK
jgi:hypothetical protein